MKKPNIFKGRTKEWDESQWQGKRNEQVEFSQMVIGACFVIAFVIAGIVFCVKSMN
jgi:hypothetical protein